MIDFKRLREDLYLKKHTLYCIVMSYLHKKSHMSKLNRSTLHWEISYGCLGGNIRINSYSFGYRAVVNIYLNGENNNINLDYDCNDNFKWPKNINDLIAKTILTNYTKEEIGTIERINLHKKSNKFLDDRGQGVFISSDEFRKE